MSQNVKEIVATMISNFWAWDNNEVCISATKRALKELGFTDSEISRFGDMYHYKEIEPMDKEEFEEQYLYDFKGEFYD